MSANRLWPVGKSLDATPSDTVNISDSGKAVLCRGISVGVAGDVAYKDEDGTTRVAKGLIAGVIHPISTRRIMLTGTTATGVQVHW